MVDCDIVMEFLQRFNAAKRPKMLQIYITSFEEHMSVCEAALSAKDSETLRAHVHDFKSLFYTLGADAEGKVAEEIEHSLITNQPDHAFAAMPEFLNRVNEVLGIMRMCVSKCT